MTWRNAGRNLGEVVAVPSLSAVIGITALTKLAPRLAPRPEPIMDPDIAGDPSVNIWCYGG